MRSNYAVTSASKGKVVRTGNGAVVVDLDDDGIEQTGWTIHYLHIDTIGRVEVGTQLDFGDVIGYPSCEGGFSTATHLHIARRYNGVWIAAAGSVPFNLEGWVAESAGIEYDGYLVKDERSIEAWNGQFAINQIGR
jgi:murein DD-endopeptidase MepM/ murein hydrolase activator NlpD